jgi:hypothetical protein
MDVPEKEYIPQDWTIKAVTANAMTTHIADIIVRFPIIS